MTPGPQSTAADTPAPLPPSVEVGGEEKLPPVPAPAAANAAADPSSAFETQKAGLEIYFDESQRLFWTRNKGGRWVDLSEGGLKRLLKKELGLRDKPNPGKAISPLDEEVSRIENESRIAYGGLLAGYRAGMHVVAGRMVLVTEDPVFIEPVKGDWPVLEKIFEGLLAGEEPIDDKGNLLKIDQRPRFFAWLRRRACRSRGCEAARSPRPRETPSCRQRGLRGRRNRAGIHLHHDRRGRAESPRIPRHLAHLHPLIWNEP